MSANYLRFGYRIAIVAVIALQACGDPTEMELMASAKALVQKNDSAAAIIELKRVVRLNPRAGEARFLLGKLLVENGDPGSAAIELQKAVELKVSDELVLPALARALLLQREDRKLIDGYRQISLANATAQADLLTSLATAYMRLGKQELSERSIADALALAPDFAPAILRRARSLADKNDIAGALDLIDKVIERDATSHDAWLLKGDLQHYAMRDPAAALSAYRKAVQLHANLPTAHQNIVTLLVERQDIEAANAHVAELSKKQPNRPTTKLLEAQMAFVRKDYAATRELAAPLVQLEPNNALLLQLAGAAEYHLRDYGKAETLLSQALKSAPHLPLARHLLAQTYLRTGQVAATLETLAPALQATSADPELLALAGEAYLQAGDAKAAEAMFTRAAKLRPDDARIGTSLALTQLAGGKGAGLAELEAIAARDKGVSADLGLIAAHLRLNELDRALAAIDRLMKKRPGEPLAAFLRGRTLVLRKDSAGARASFDDALRLDSKFFPAIENLAALDIAENRSGAARRRFEDLLKVQPQNYRAMMALADLLPRTGGTPQDVKSMLERAASAAPVEPAPRLRLIGHHLAAGRPAEAVAAAQAALVAQPASSELLDAQGRAQLAAGAHQQAMSSYNALVSKQPQSPLPLLGLAEAYRGLKDPAGAERSLNRALAIVPDHLAAQRLLASLMVQGGRHAEALAIARRIQQQRPKGAAGYQLEGDIEMSRKNWEPALAAFRKARQMDGGTESAIKLHTALLVAGRADEAGQFASAWQKEQAKDAAFRYYLGDSALMRSDWATAESHYRAVLALQPDHPMALNNVAWLLLKQSKPGALAVAERANSLHPYEPAIMDTLAAALASEGQLSQALLKQAEAVKLSPETPALRLNLARMYLQSGDKGLARSELKVLSKLGTGFPQQAEVTELLKGL